MPSEVTNIDSLLSGSILIMPSRPSDVVIAEAVWEDYTVNTVMIIVGAVLTAILIPALVRLFRHLVGGIFRDKPVLKIDGNVGLTVNRNELAIVMLIPFSIVISKFGIYEPSFLSWIPASSYSLALLAIAALVFMFKSLMCSNVQAKSSMRNIFIVTTILVILTAAILGVFYVHENSIKVVIITEIALMYTISTTRTLHFFKDNSKVFNAIMYLCALEIIPAIIVIATAIL